MFSFVRRPLAVRCVCGRPFIQETTSKLKTLDDLPGPDAGLSKLARASKYANKIWRLVRVQFDDKPIGDVVFNSHVRDVKKYGKIFRSDFTGLRPEIVLKIANPADVEKLFRSEALLPLRPDSPVQRHYREQIKKPPGMIFSNGEHWYKLRHVSNKKLLRPREIPAYVPELNEITTDLLTRLRKVRGSGEHPHEIPDLQNELFRWSFESVCHVLFDRRIGSLEQETNIEAEQFISAVSQFLDSSSHVEGFPWWFYKIFPTSMYRQFTKSTDTIYHYVDLFIERKLQEFKETEKLEVESAAGHRAEFIPFLLASNLSDEDVVATAVDLLVAGVDTTATAMQWCLYLLAKNPEKQDKLYREVHSVLKGGILSSDQLSGMPYLKACIKETMRIYPLAFHQRILGEDVELGGFHIPAGTSVMTMHYAMCQDQELFENPSEFKPERWLRSPEQTSKAIKPFSFLPFGYGKRMCVGRRIADLEMYLLLARIIQNFVVASPHKEEVRKSLHGIVIIPARPVRIQLIERMG